MGQPSLWVGLALRASLLSIWRRIATAVAEIVIGTSAQLLIGAAFEGALLAGDATWIRFLSGAGAILLTFLAGDEFDPPCSVINESRSRLASPVGKDHTLIRRLRTLIFGLLAPLYFIRAGSLVSLPALIATPLAFLALRAGKMVTEVIVV